jgi:acyl carrier protein
MTTTAHPPVPGPAATPAADVLVELTAVLAGVKRIAPQAVDVGQPFAVLGLDSLLAAEFASALSARYGTRITPAALADHPTPAALARHVAAVLATPWPVAPTAPATPLPAPGLPAGGPATPGNPPGDEARGDAAGGDEAGGGPGAGEVLAELRAQLAAILRCHPQDIDVTAPVTSLGLDSILMAGFIAGLNHTFHLSEHADLLYEHRELTAIAAYVATRLDPAPPRAPRPRDGAGHGGVLPDALLDPAREPAPAPVPVPLAAVPERTDDDNNAAASGDGGGAGRRGALELLAVPTGADLPDAVEPGAVPPGAPCAIVGLHGRFPQAPDLDAWWRNALQARTGAPAPGSAPGDGSGSAPGDGYLIEGAEEFDAQLFGLDPAAAALLDPQERLLVHSAWQALESAGYAGERIRALASPASAARSVGCFLAVGSGDYALLTATAPDATAPDATGPDAAGPVPGGPVPVGVGFGMAGRISALLDLRGPSQVVDSGASSFLTALHLALAALRAGECAAALVGAVDLRLHPARRWPGAGEGVAAVLLRPLGAARADGDRIHAVVRSSAVGHPGRGGAPTAPAAERARAERALAERALAVCGAGAGSVGLVEDPGTVAGLVGDAGAATGAAALVRAVLQLRNATLLAGGDRPGPVRWQRPVDADGVGLPRRAQVSVGAPGQAQAVVLLEEAGADACPAGPQAPAGPGHGGAVPELVLLSAPTPQHLAATAARFARWLSAPGGAGGDLAAVARELRVGRAAMACRLAVVATDVPELARALAAFAQQGPDDSDGPNPDDSDGPSLGDGGLSDGPGFGDGGGLGDGPGLGGGPGLGLGGAPGGVAGDGDGGGFGDGGGLGDGPGLGGGPGLGLGGAPEGVAGDGGGLGDGGLGGGPGLGGVPGLGLGGAPGGVAGDGGGFGGGPGLGGGGGGVVVRGVDLRGVEGAELLLGGLEETRVYVDALWRGRRLEQLARLWLAGADVLCAPARGHRVVELPLTALRTRPLWFAGTGRGAGGGRPGGRR